ncbi:hypothetical protein [Paludibaculum fermentans]|uniref:hypothetical protein n=1 Tax=Paludibaculum fermentans TaxID=1473598 RepID=UPI003EC02E4E
MPQAYGGTGKRLLIVGQQTFGWSSDVDKRASDPIEWLMDNYDRFALGREYWASPFWQAAHQLNEKLNPESSAASFLWSNLIKVDQDGERPTQEVEEAVCALRLLPTEIEIVCPDVVVFFTGPRYDDRLRASFDLLRLVETDKTFSRVIHPALPHHSYRTPHPKYLRLSKQSDTLTRLADRANQVGPQDSRLCCRGLKDLVRFTR